MSRNQRNNRDPRAQIRGWKQVQLPRKDQCERGRGQFVEVRRDFKFHLDHNREPLRVLSRE